MIPVRRSRPTPEVFWSRVSFPRGGTGGCWIWMGGFATGGYGKVRGDLAHRVSYRINVGVIEDGLQIDHLCRNRACVNPAHLEAVTLGENVRRGHNHNRDKTECRNGHPYSPGNTDVELSTWRSGRKCKTCRQANARRRYAARQAHQKKG